MLGYILGEEYIKSLIANPELVDRLALSSDDLVDVFSIMSLFLSRCPGSKTLEIDLVSQSNLSFCATAIYLFLPQNEITSSKVLFPEHLPLSTIQIGIKNGSFLQGTFRASRDNYLEATVVVHGDGEDGTEVCESTFTCE